MAFKESGNGALIRNGHIPRKFSISIVFFLQHGSEEMAKVLPVYMHHRHSQVAGGLEIPCKCFFTAKTALTETLKTSSRKVKFQGFFHFSTSR